jgi:hypothetical protein
MAAEKGNKMKTRSVLAWGPRQARCWLVGAASVVLSLGVMATAAHAQPAGYQSPAAWGYDSYDSHEQHEYDQGYRDGSHSGMEDARHHRAFSMYDHGSYRDHHDPSYREGYERGYREAYRANRYDRDSER